MNSRGCNPRWAHSNEEPTLKGSNYGGQAGSSALPGPATSSPGPPWVAPTAIHVETLRVSGMDSQPAGKKLSCTPGAPGGHFSLAGTAWRQQVSSALPGVSGSQHTSTNRNDGNSKEQKTMKSIMTASSAVPVHPSGDGRATLPGWATLLRSLGDASPTLERRFLTGPSPGLPPSRLETGAPPARPEPCPTGLFAVGGRVAGGGIGGGLHLRRPGAADGYGHGHRRGRTSGGLYGDGWWGRLHRAAGGDGGGRRRQWSHR